MLRERAAVRAGQADELTVGIKAMSGTTISGSIISYTIASDGFTLTNLGTIGSSASVGVMVTGNNDTVINAGTIAGYNGVKFSGAGALTNALGGVIKAMGFNGFGVLLTASSAAENAGGIGGSGDPLLGGQITNQLSGTLSGGVGVERG